MILRPASFDDVPELTRLGRESFCAAFGHLYKPEDLDAFLGQVFTEEVVAREVADDTYIHQLACDADALIGYCKLISKSDYASYSDAKNPMMLAQLYTDSDRTGGGIGSALMDWAMAESRARECDAIQLTVWSENFGAQRFYERYGFAKIADVDFYVGTHRDDEFLFELRLD